MSSIAWGGWGLLAGRAADLCGSAAFFAQIDWSITLGSSAGIFLVWTLARFSRE
ncbi:MAG: hypothetical protein IJM30_11545 [Thermoguttaceae bacterium]|nr:hypothetical protein [Thermoguttaceae bacterium]